MTAVLRIVANVLSVAALSILLLLPSSKYAWIEELDPQMSASAFEDASGDRTLVVGLLLAFIVAIQLLVAFRSPSRQPKLTAAFIVSVALIAGVMKFVP